MLENIGFLGMVHQQEQDIIINTHCFQQLVIQNQLKGMHMPTMYI